MSGSSGYPLLAPGLPCSDALISIQGGRRAAMQSLNPVFRGASLLVASLGLVLVGCGGSDSSGNTTSSSDPTGTTSPTETSSPPSSTTSCTTAAAAPTAHLRPLSRAGSVSLSWAASTGLPPAARSLHTASIAARRAALRRRRTTCWPRARRRPRTRTPRPRQPLTTTSWRQWTLSGRPPRPARRRPRSRVAPRQRLCRHRTRPTSDPTSRSTIRRFPRRPFKRISTRPFNLSY